MEKEPQIKSNVQIHVYVQLSRETERDLKQSQIKNRNKQFIQSKQHKNAT